MTRAFITGIVLVLSTRSAVSLVRAVISTRSPSICRSVLVALAGSSKEASEATNFQMSSRFSLSVIEVRSIVMLVCS